VQPRELHHPGDDVWSELHCCKEYPWDHKPRSRTRVHHADAHEVGDQRNGYPGGDIVTLRCPHCGHEWDEELPQ